MNNIASVEPTRAEAAIRQWCADFNIAYRDTWTPADAAAFLSALDFDVNPGTVGEFTRKGYLVAPEPAALRTADLYALMLALECRRRWKRTPSIHDPKKSAMRLRLELASRDNPGECPVNDLDAYTVEDLLLLLVAEPHPAMREALYEGVRLKLAGFEE